MAEGKSVELRSLTSDDIFPMISILSKIGIKNIKNCFDGEETRKAIADMVSGKTNADLESVGLSVALDIAGLVMENLPKCKDDLYLFLAQLSGKKQKEIAAMPMADFTRMIIAVVKKEEFKDFFQAVSEFMN